MDGGSDKDLNSVDDKKLVHGEETVDPSIAEESNLMDGRKRGYESDNPEDEEAGEERIHENEQNDQTDPENGYLQETRSEHE